MAVTKEKKEELVADILEKVKKSQAVYVTSYQGMTMNQFNTLRSKLKASNGAYHVVKNSLAARALKEAGLAVPSELLEGPVALGFAYSDMSATAKAFLDFAKEAEKFQVKGAILGQQVLSPKDVEALSAMPPLPVVRAQLLGLISSPASRIAGVVASGVRQVVNVVKAYADREEKAAAPAAA
jgi:large subunit ribosomal protein L10